MGHHQHEDHHHHNHHDHSSGEGHHHHHHEHDHAHHEHGSGTCCTPKGALTEKDKLEKIVHHWIHHNEEHARSYREWGDRARALGQDEVGRMLDSIADENLRLNEQMQKILRILESR